MIRPRSLRSYFALVTAGLLACSGTTDQQTAPAGEEVAVTRTAATSAHISVSVVPATAALKGGNSRKFACIVTGSTDRACTWSVQEGASGGSVTSAGVYTAPAYSGTYHLVARSHADSTRSATATMTVFGLPPVVAVSVSPTTASLAPRGSQTFTCAVTGSSDKACTWSVQEGASGGSVTTAGVYTAPSTAGTYHVVARSHADTTKAATATVTDTAPPASVAISTSPTSASVDACQTYAFRASVTGTSNTAATWSVTESTGGTVSSSGVYTAPANGGTYHVVATSQADPSKSQTATLTVTERIVSVSVSPSTISVAPGGSAQFTATVTTTCGSFTQTVAAAN